MEVKEIYKRKKLYILILFVLLIVFLFAGLFNRLTVTKYTIQNDKIETDIKIVLLTDLHSCSYGESQNQLIEAIDKQSPDLILLSGDILDDVLPDDNVMKLLDGIADRYPCYYVTGNHEFWSGRVKEQKEMFHSYGVEVLEGDSRSILLNGQTISICGVDDPAIGKESFERQLDAVIGTVNEEQYTILLSHRPELFMDYAKGDFDLVLSGHAHGGQWRLPLILPNGLYAPAQGFFPEYTKGVHTYNNTKMVVSRGLSKESTRIPRFFNPPEIVVINLVSNSLTEN